MDNPAPRPGRPGRYGSAGASLSGNDAVVNKYGRGSVQAGITGEKWLIKALQGDPRTQRYPIWQSLGIPGPAGGKRGGRYASDVDFALASGSTLLLIDCKKWAAGSIYWSIGGTPMKGFSVMKSNNSYGDQQPHLSKNMATAVDRYSDNLPGITVRAIVLFVPTKAGIPTSVRWLRWPGGIRSYLPGDGVRKASRILGEPKPVDPQIQALLGRMLRT